MAAPTQYGNTKVLVGSNPNDAATLLDTYGAHGVDTDKLTNLPGAWVLSLRTLEIVPNNPAGNALEVNPAIALVSFGSGGMLMQVAVNVFPDAIIQLPSATCRVDLLWDKIPAGYSRPTSVRVAAILQRTNEAISTARRLIFLPLTIAAVATPPELDIQVPAYARGVRPWGDSQASISYSSDVIWSFLTHGGASKFGTTAAAQSMTGQQLGAQAMQGREYDLPSGAQAMQGGFASVAPFGAFPLTLTVPWGLDWRIEL